MTATNDHPTPAVLRAAHNVEEAVRIENMWGAVLALIEEVQTTSEKTQDVSLLTALRTAETALYDASSAFGKASSIVRRGKR